MHLKNKRTIEFKPSETLVNKCVLVILAVISAFIVLLYILFVYVFLLGGFIEINE